MLAILLPIKSRHCVNIANGIKNLEIRKNKALKTAIQKLIDKYGYATIYGYCSKINRKDYHLIESITDKGETEYEVDYYIGSEGYLDYCFDGKVMFKFHCNNVENIGYNPRTLFDADFYYLNSPISVICASVLGNPLYVKSCLSKDELHNYLKGKTGYAIHISDLEVFDKPRKLSEFNGIALTNIGYCLTDIKKQNPIMVNTCKKLTKAPQNFAYIVDELDIQSFDKGEFLR